MAHNFSALGSSAVRTTSPPNGFLAKFAFYRSKYGAMHALSSYAGRQWPLFWRFAGPLTTQKYFKNWKCSAEPRILNLGGGSHCIEGCLTADIDARADFYVDVSKPLPFDSSSVDAIFCEELIEHIDLPLGRKLLQECRRILIPDGVLRLTTPDLDWFARRILNDFTGWSDTNSIFYEHRHRCIYTPVSLQQLCRESGFIDIRASSYKEDISRLGYLDSHADRYHHPPEMSQYLEVFKPSASVER